MSILDDARALRDDLTQLRRRLHQLPEIGLDLPRTQETVLGALEGLPLEVTTGRDLTSVTAILRGTGPDRDAAAPRTVLLRGDMDALPVRERTNLDYSAGGDTMHACGHDLHTTMLVGAARLLASHRHQLAGDVVFMFQPGEEGFDGARVMVDEGALDAAGRRADAAFAIHVAAAMLPAGTFATRGGTLMSASDTLRVTVRGAGGHGSVPHRARDPIPVACEMVTALQTLVTRRFDVFDPVVVTVGTFHGGTAANVIPDTAAFEATMRSFSAAGQARLRDESVGLCRGIAAAYGVELDIAIDEGYPVTVNNTCEVGIVADLIRDVHGEARFIELPNPLTGSEDFSRVLDAVPGSMALLGTCPPERDPERAPFNHSPEAAFDDGWVSDGAGIYAEWAHRRLLVLTGGAGA